jgi:fructose-1,6-bisphosphatase/inositol monophosphatase family enzyme
VTVVDRAVEQRLGLALASLLPGSLVVGEEAVHADPRRLEALGGTDPVWLIDPLDGTKNFVRGQESFGVMVALLEGPLTRAAWIALPARAQTYVAVHGAGTFLNGHRVQVPATSSEVPATSPDPGRPRGTLYTGFMPRDLAELVVRTMGAGLPAWGAAAFEYTSLVRGEKDFVVYHRLLPWDHLPGALVLTEAGGWVEHLDGRPYGVGSRDQVTILGATRQVCEAVRERLAQR